MLFFSLFLASIGCVVAVEIPSIFQWKYIDYDWRTIAEKQRAIRTGVYNHSQVLPYDFELTEDGRWFITCPKYHYVNPATLSTISASRGDGGPLLKPYPNWDWHNQGDCSSIINALRVASDDCGRLWVVDSGKVLDKQVCPAKILAFDLATDELLTRFRIPKRVWRGGYLEIQFVETRDKCGKTWVYISDVAAGGIIIFDGSSIWRRDNDVLNVAPMAITVGDCSTEIDKDIGLGIMVPVSRNTDGDGLVLMRSLSRTEFYLTTLNDLHNSKHGDLRLYANEFSHSDPVWTGAFSQDGIAFACILPQMTLNCWGNSNQFRTENGYSILVDRKRFDTVTSMKIVQDEDRGEMLYIMSNRYLKFRLRRMDFSEVNVRIMGAPVRDLVSGTTCESSGQKWQLNIKDLGFSPLQP